MARTSAKLAVLRARQLLKEKRLADVLQVCNDELARGADLPELRLIAAHSLLAQGRHEGAKKEAQQVVRSDPTQAEAHRILADIACARGELATACEHLERVLDLDPDDGRSRSLLETLSRPSTLPPPVSGAAPLPSGAASLDRFIQASTPDPLDDEDRDLSDPAMEVSDSMIEQLPDEDDDQTALSPPPEHPFDSGEQPPLIVEEAGDPPPGLSTVHDETHEEGDQWLPGQRVEASPRPGTLRLPAIEGLPDEEDAPTVPLLRPTAPPEPVLKLDPLADRPVTHESRDRPSGPAPRTGPAPRATGPAPRSTPAPEARRTVLGPGPGAPVEPDEFEEFVEPASVPVAPVSHKIPDEAANAVNVRAQREPTDGDPLAMMAGLGGGRNDTGTDVGGLEIKSDNDPSDAFEDLSAPPGELMQMMAGGTPGPVVDESLPRLERRRGAAREPVSEEGWDPLAEAASSDEALERELMAAGLAEAPRKSAGKRGLWVALALVLVGSGTVGFFWYRSYRYIQGQWQAVRAAIHRSTPAGFRDARSAAQRILDKREASPKAKAALAVYAAAMAIEFGEDRLSAAKKLLDETRGSDSEWRTAAQGYLSLVDDPAGAAGYLRKGCEVFPDSALLRYLRGRALAASGEPRAAGESYQEALKLQPNFVAAKIQLAVLLGRQPRGYEQSLDAFNEILRSNPDNIQALIERAHLGARHGKGLSQAAQDAERVGGPLAEKAGRGQIGWSQLVLAQIARQHGDVGAMSRALDAAIKAPPCCDSRYRFELAGELARIFRFGDAVRQMRAALELKRDDTSYLLRIARLLLEVDKAREAADYLKQAPARQIETRLLGGRVALALGQHDKAIEALQQVLREQPENLEAARFLALAQAKKGQQAAAIRRLQELHNKHRNNHLLPQSIGRVAYWGGDYKAAEEALRSSWRLNGLDPRTATLLARVSVKLGDLPRAEKRFNTALGRRPDFAPAHIGLAHLKLQQGQLDEARRQAAQVSESDRERASYHVLMAQLDLAEGKLDEAAQNVERATSAGAPRTEVIRLKGELALRQGNFKLAVQALGEARKAAPKDAELLVELGQAMRRAGQLDAAYDALHDALGLDKKHPIALFELGELALADQEYTLAIKRHKDALAQLKARGMPASLQAQAFASIGLAYLKKRDTGRAITHLQDAMDLDPQAAQPLLRMGMTYDALDRPNRALPYYRKAIELDPRLLDAYLLGGQAAAKSGDSASAVVLLQAYLERAPEGTAGRRTATQLLARLQ